ncbi:MAG: hypothetical protein CEE38_08460 [Planctomycetes bacterium B3_Pla]|nr:MAG: hypothetical protein CEE38_08460 [Planctomycetes bacterium B3_Pla]
MIDFKIIYKSLASGKYPDIRDVPVEKWVTVRQALEAGKPVVIDAVAEYMARHGRGCELSEGIEWQEYFAWLAGFEDAATLPPWNELRKVIELRLTNIFGERSVPALASEPASPKPQVEERPVEMPGQPQKKETYWDVVRRLVPSPPMPQGRSFVELYIDV